MNKHDREQILKGLDDPCRGLVVAHSSLRKHSITPALAAEADRIQHLINSTFLFARDIRCNLEEMGI